MGADTHDPYYFDRRKRKSFNIKIAKDVYKMKNQIYYFHGKTQEGNRFTIAGKFNKDKTLIAAISLCSDSDQFDRKLGRIIASSRLESDKDHVRGRIKIPEFFPSSEKNEGKEFSDACSAYETMSTDALKSVFGFLDLKKYSPKTVIDLV